MVLVNLFLSLVVFPVDHCSIGDRDTTCPIIQEGATEVNDP